MRVLRYLQISLLIIAAAACKQELIHNLSEDESNVLLTKLYKANIEAQKDKQPDGRWSLIVHDSDAKVALDLLHALRVLPNREESSTSSSFLLSPEESRLMYERKKGEEIARSISSLSGVLEAQVHLNLPRQDFLTSKKSSEGTASVLMVVQSTFAIESSQIAALVSGAAGVPLGGVQVLISTEKAEDPKSLPTAILPDLTVTAKKNPILNVINKYRDYVNAICFALGIILCFALLRRRLNSGSKPITLKSINESKQASPVQLVM